MTDVVTVRLMEAMIVGAIIAFLTILGRRAAGSPEPEESPQLRKRFRFVTWRDGAPHWQGPYSRGELIDLIKSGTIQIDTQVWDDVLAQGHSGTAWQPAWKALDIPRQPMSLLHPTRVLPAIHDPPPSGTD